MAAHVTFTNVKHIWMFYHMYVLPLQRIDVRQYTHVSETTCSLIITLPSGWIQYLMLPLLYYFFINMSGSLDQGNMSPFIHIQFSFIRWRISEIYPFACFPYPESISSRALKARNVVSWPGGAGTSLYHWLHHLLMVCTFGLHWRIYGPKCSQFHAVYFLENLAKLYVGAPWRVSAPSYEESWIPPWPVDCKCALMQK